MNGETTQQKRQNFECKNCEPQKSGISFGTRLSKIGRTALGLFVIGACIGNGYAAQLTLTWSDNSDNEDGFNIERSLDGTNFAQIGSVAANESNFLDTTVVENQVYTYRVNAYNASGVSDYTNTASGSVDNPNDAPIISTVSDISILEGGESGTISFTIGDTETGSGELVVSASSSNLSLLANEGIALSGSGANRSLALFPVGGASGTSTVTLSVSDGTNTTTGTFLLTVQSITAPTITSIGDISIAVGEVIDPIGFTIADAETSAENLNVSVATSNETLLPVQNIVVSGTGANRTLTLTPVANLSGTSTITISVSDGTGEAIETFVVNSLSAPVILTQPADREGIVGDINAMEVVVSAFPEPAYQWLFNGVPISGATEATLLFDGLSLSQEGFYSVIVANSNGIVTSEEAQLLVESQINVTQAPISQTINGEGNVVLSVVADGPGLTYQWYRGESGDKSDPIEGATSGTYETDTLSADANFWVEIKTGGIAQAAESFSSDTIVITFEALPRYFFGTFGPGNDGSFGLMVRGDNTAVLLAYIESLDKLVETSDMIVSSSDTFSYEEDGVGVLSGSIDGEVVSGAVSGTELTFTGTMSDIDGPTAPLSGFYYAVMSNTSDGQTLVIAGPDGNSFVTVRLGASGMGGEAVLSTNGAISANLGEGLQLSFSLDQSVLSLRGTAQFGGSAFSLSGQREEMERTDILFNTSIRAKVREGASSMIAGFVVGGSGQKKVLIRGIGPSLQAFGLADAVSDPRITLYRMGENDPIAQNDDWADASNASDVSISSQLVGAFPLASNSKDAALLMELPAGVYTAHAASNGGSEGTALLEVYDVSEAEESESSATLVNISLRGEVRTGDDVIIAGFVVTGDSAKRLLIRAMGSELERFGVPGTLADPRLEIFQQVNGEMVSILSNDDWTEESATASGISAQTGAFPFDEGSKSAAQVVWLEPGIYTAIASSGDGSSGVALVEVYDAP